MNKAKFDNIIGIDPDKDKSGVAFLQPSSRILEVTTLTFPELLEYLQSCKKKSFESGQSLIVVVEAGWHVAKSNYHPYQGRRAEKIAKDVGANHETGRKIVEMAKHYGIRVIEQPPLRKVWKGQDRKITHEELSSFTGLKGRTNQEMRDAALIAWVVSGLPIQVKV